MIFFFFFKRLKRLKNSSLLEARKAESLATLLRLVTGRVGNCLVSLAT